MFTLPTKEITDIKRNGKVRQANALIRSKQPLDLMQKRLFYLILEAIRTTDTQFQFVEFPVPILKELLGGYYGSFHTDLFASAQGLVSTSFSVLSPSGSWVTTPIFDRIESLKAGDTNNKGYTNIHRYDVVRAKLHEDLEPYLLRLERSYNTQDLIYVLTIPRVRSHRLYEILLHESWRGERAEFDMPVDELQAFLGIEEGYRRWQDFKRMLKRQQQIVHAYTDLHFTFEGRRTGRTVSLVHFYVSFIQKQGVPHLTDPGHSNEEIPLVDELKQAGYQQDPYDAIREYGLQRVRDALAQARAAQKASRGTKGEIRNLGGFIHYLMQTQQVSDQSARTPLGDKELHAIAEMLLEKYEQRRDEAIEQALQNLDEETRDELNRMILGMLNAFERVLVEDDASLQTYAAIRNRYILEHNLLELPGALKSARIFYRDKDFGYDQDISERIHNLL